MFWKKSPPSGERIDNPAIVGMVTAESGAFVVHLNVADIGNAGVAGVMLADLAVHIAKALTMAKMAAAEDTALNEIVRVFNAERQNPTDDPVGGLVQ